jgi:hypothetical protein
MNCFPPIRHEKTQLLLLAEEGKVYEHLLEPTPRFERFHCVTREFLKVQPHLFEPQEMACYPPIEVGHFPAFGHVL